MKIASAPKIAAFVFALLMAGGSLASAGGAKNYGESVGGATVNGGAKNYGEGAGGLTVNGGAKNYGE